MPKNKRNEYDFYITPISTIETLFKNIDLSKFGSSLLEPSAGNGAFVKTINKYYPNKNITSIEIRDEEQNNLTKAGSSKVIIDNFLSIENLPKYDIIIGNPPFSLAKEFVEKSLSLLNDTGILIFLLRTAFLESKKRYDFWKIHPINGLYVLSTRPSFTGAGTDATSYSFFIWNKNTTNQEIKVI